MYSMLIVRAYYEGKVDFEFIPENKVIISDLIKEVENRFKRKHGKKAGSVVSLAIDERVDVDAIGKEYKAGWANGAKTIPVYSFEVRI